MNTCARSAQAVRRLPRALGRSVPVRSPRDTCHRVARSRPPDKPRCHRSGSSATCTAISRSSARHGSTTASRPSSGSDARSSTSPTIHTPATVVATTRQLHHHRPPMVLRERSDAIGGRRGREVAAGKPGSPSLRRCVALFDNDITADDGRTARPTVSIARTRWSAEPCSNVTTSTSPRHDAGSPPSRPWCSISAAVDSSASSVNTSTATDSGIAACASMHASWPPPTTPTRPGSHGPSGHLSGKVGPSGHLSGKPRHWSAASLTALTHPETVTEAHASPGDMGPVGRPCRDSAAQLRLGLSHVRARGSQVPPGLSSRTDRPGTRLSPP